VKDAIRRAQGNQGWEPMKVTCYDEMRSGDSFSLVLNKLGIFLSEFEILVERI